MEAGDDGTEKSGAQVGRGPRAGIMEHLGSGAAGWDDGNRRKEQGQGGG